MPRPRRAGSSAPGICNGRSQIVWRRLSRERVELDEAYLAGGPRARHRPARRRAPTGASSGRSPTTFPASSPTSTATPWSSRSRRSPWRSARRSSATCSTGILHPSEVIFRNDAPIRRLEGLALEIHTRSGSAVGAAVGGNRRDSRCGSTSWGARRPASTWTSACSTRRSRSTARGKSVLDAFCNQGSFALHAAKAGADGGPRPGQRGRRDRRRAQERREERASRPSSRSPTSSTG